MLPKYVQATQSTTNKDLGKEHKLTAEEWSSLVEGLGREPTLLELGVVSALWSEHCSYKSSRRLLGQFLTSGPQVLQGPGENAGVIDIGDGWAVAFKMESHNHPSFIEPYQGAATGVGGIMRDVFTMGARPIASLNALRFGDPHDAKWRQKTKSLVHGVVAGIGGYGNCMGVPTVGGETWFHKSYNQNNLVNAFNLGLLRADSIFLGTAEGVGNPVLYVGSKTGRDGIHGASMASDSFSEEGADQRPTVQAGDPFQEKKLLEACLELMQEDCIVGIQDMGAAGLTSSAFEMAERAGNGLMMDLSKVPTREPEMSPYELMLSESQERMLMVMREGTEEVAERIFEKWHLDVETIGKVIEGDSVDLYWGEDQLCSLPIELSVSGFGLPHREQGQPEAYPLVADETIPAVTDWEQFLPGWMAEPNQASKAWIYEQYDSTVQAATRRGPGAEAAVVSPAEIAPKAIAMTADCNSRYVAVHPFEGGRHTVAGAMRNLACVGADSLGMTDCLNFGNPEKPEIYGAFAQAIAGVAEAGRSCALPVVSGNVSLYNETDHKGVFPTPEIGVVGTIPTWQEAERSGQPGDTLLLVGDFAPEWGGSQYALDCLGYPVGPLPVLDWQREATMRNWVIQTVRSGKVLDAKDVGSGGLLTSMLQLVYRHGKLGVHVNSAITTRVDGSTEQFWLGETSASYLLMVKPENKDEISSLAQQASVPCQVLGSVESDVIKLASDTTIDAKKVYSAWRFGLQTWLDNDA